MTIDGVTITDLPESPCRELTLPSSDDPPTLSKGKKSKSKSKSKSSSSSSKKGLKSKPNLIKVLREAVGKDFSRITMPVYFNEPLSFLQRVCEDVEHSELLDAAADPSLSGSSRRVALVGAFVISHYSSTVDRTSKPFNPMLGETFDYVNHERNVVMLSEQVSHHPPVTALHAYGAKGWEYYTSYRVRSKFHGNTFEAWPQGEIHIVFPDNNDHFVYEQVHTFVNNIVVGSLWIDNVGQLKINEVNHNQYFVDVNFKRYSSSSSSSMFSMSSGGDRAHRDKSLSYGAVDGVVRNKQTDAVCHTVSGNWRKSLDIDGKCVWTGGDVVDKEMTGGYQMTKWAWTLNTVPDLAAYPLPKTDSRLRPDQRALENGDYDSAASQKDRLEKAQRERRHENNNDSNGSPTTSGKTEEDTNDSETTDDAKWFEFVEDQQTGRMEWRYKGGYFKDKLEAFRQRQQDLGDDVKINGEAGGHWPNEDQITDIF